MKFLQIGKLEDVFHCPESHWTAVVE